MKKQIFSTLVLSMCLLLPFSLYSQEQRKKVGVVLSGGGAKGMAHIKALKVIEEAGIPIDCRRTLRYWLYSRAIGQYGSKTKLDVSVKRPYQTKCHVIDRP